MLDNEPTNDSTTHEPGTPEAEAPKKAPRRRATKAAAAPIESPEAVETPAADEGEAPKKAVKKAPAKKAAPRKKAAPKVDPNELADELTAEADATAEGMPVEPEAAPVRRTRAPAVVVTFQAPDAAEAKPRRRAGTAGVLTPTLKDVVEDVVEDEDETEDEDGTSQAARRRRRGRRGRGGARPAQSEGEGDEVTEETESTEDEQDDDDEEDGPAGAGTRRRRRRRRSGGGGGSAAEGDDDVPTVVHVREPGSRNQGGNQGGNQNRQRSSRDRDGGGAADEDGVRGIAGSTRMAAKRVRRQEGRDTGRKRAPILTEAEFLARREAVDRQMIVRQKGDRTQIAVLEDGILVEHYVTKASATSYAGNVYLGRVQNVLPSMEAAFVDIGKGRNAVLYAGEVNWEGVSGGSRKIEQVLKSGQEVLVQVSKDPIGHKGARLTSQISLPGRYLVYVPESSMTGISRKLPENERTRLKNILKNVVPEGAGVIIRTAADGVPEEEIAKDVRRLQAQWEVISGKVAKGGAPVQLHAEPDLVIRVVRDIFNEDFARLVVQGDTEWDTIKDYVEFVAPDLAPRLAKWAGERDVFAEHRIDEQLLKALDRKVHLPSGGSLVIDRTEAMVVVDVNTGKFVGKGGNLEETVTRNNLEAAEEIARQLRLRDLGGIIVVDFIDMVLESNRDLVVRRLVECLGRDRTKHQVAEVTSLGLVQMTRKRVGQGLLESFSETCEHCAGRGVVLHAEPLDDRPAPRDRDRTPRVTPRPPKPGPYAEPAAPAASADEPAGESPGPKRRRRGGRGTGSATQTPESEVAELLGAVEDEVEVEVEVAPAGPHELGPELAVELAELAAPEPEPVADSPKRRRRATSRPAGPPGGS